ELRRDVLRREGVGHCQRRERAERTRFANLCGRDAEPFAARRGWPFELELAQQKTSRTACEQSIIRRRFAVTKLTVGGALRELPPGPLVIGACDGEPGRP